MNIAVCDDEKNSREKLITFLNKYNDFGKKDIYITEFSSGNSFLQSSKVFDLIFMDYMMDGLDGIETVQKIRMINKDVKVIFLSSYKEIVFDTFEVDTFRFLIKPVNEEKLFLALDDYFKSINNDDYFIVKTKEKSVRIKLSEIIYAESQGKHSIIRTTKEPLHLLKMLKDIEKLLPKDKFSRCHKSYLVSYEHVYNHTKSEITFDNGEKSCISRDYYVAFKNGLQDYIKKYKSRGLI